MAITDIFKRGKNLPDDDYDLEDLEMESSGIKLGSDGEFTGPVSPAELERMRNQLIQHHTDLVVRAMMDDRAREDLAHVVKSTFNSQTNNGADNVVNYVVDEVIKSGVVIMPSKDNDQVLTDMPRMGTPDAPPSQNEMWSKIEDVDEAAQGLKENHARLMRGHGLPIAESSYNTSEEEPTIIPRMSDDFDDLALIRQNQQRLKDWKQNGGELPGAHSPNPMDYISSAEPIPEGMFGLEAIDMETVQHIHTPKRRKSRGGSALAPTNREEILKLREGIETENVALYDGDSLEDSFEDGEQDPADFISDDELGKMRDHMVQAFPGLVIRGMMEQEARDELEVEVRSTYDRQTRGGQDFLVNYIVRETVGTGVIENILERDESITDIGYDGEKLIIESNDKKYIYKSNQEINDEYIIRLVNKFAYANGSDFTGKNPVFDGNFQNIRINAMHGDNTTGGVTMALRVVRPKLALTEATFDGFAPHYIFNVLKSSVVAKGNFMIAGETGTGKTELQKLLASFIPFDQRMVLIEDVAETFLKEMFPEKDIYSWLTSQDTDITTLVKAALRNNPRWILVSETRGMEAYEMIQAVLSGHSIITTLHAINARAIPKRLVNMAKMGYDFSEEALEGDIRRYFDFGIHIVRREYKGKTLRYLSELLYFDEEEDQTVFKQDFMDGKLIAQSTEFPEVLRRRIKQAGMDIDDFQENVAHVRDINIDEVLDDNGDMTRLDMTITEGRYLTYDELENVVQEVYIDRDKLIVPSNTEVRAVSGSSVQQARESNAPVVTVGKVADKPTTKVAGAKPKMKQKQAPKRPTVKATPKKAQPKPNTEEVTPPKGAVPKKAAPRKRYQNVSKPPVREASNSKAVNSPKKAVPKRAVPKKRDPNSSKPPVREASSSPSVNVPKKASPKRRAPSNQSQGHMGGEVIVGNPHNRGQANVERPNQQAPVKLPGVKRSE